MSINTSGSDDDFLNEFDNSVGSISDDTDFENTSVEETDENLDPVLEEESSEELEEESTNQEEEELDLESEESEEEGENSSDEDPDEGSSEGEELNYEDFYKEIMAPFKANGRQVELRDKEEVRQLLKMGANYTKKMQALSAHNKKIMMLERNNIDEDKLSYAIDLLNGESEAIKKFFADTGLDPLDIDVESEVKYEGNRHLIADNEVQLQAAIDEVMESDGGQSTIQMINSEWDKGSVTQLGQNPEVLKVIHAQKQSGVYDQVANEIARRQSLGLLSASTPFLEAYDRVGNEMINNGLIVMDGARPRVKQAPIAKGTGKVNTAANNKAKAASITTSRGGKKKADNPLEVASDLSDEDFLALMQGRV